MISHPWSPIPPDEGPDAAGSLPRAAVRERITLRHIGAVAGAFSVLMIVGLMQLGWSVDTRRQARRLALENEALIDELGRIRGKVSLLEETVEDVRGREYQVRSLAGLRPIDDDIFLAGTGGLVTTGPEDLALHAFAPEAAGAAFAIDYDVEALQQRARILLNDLGEVSDSLSSQQDRLLSLPTLFPTVGRVSSRYSRARLHPIMNEVLPHPGLDIAAPTGTPILAAGRGRVIRAGWNGGYGQMVEIDHGQGYTTLYAHGSRLLVRSGQIVERGDVIAQVGRTGIATSSHLHYEVRLNGQQQNPANFFLPGTSR